ncbi:TLR22-like protein [Mya arenaria]|uniref:TLR22-like protein n=1 Tax=Mya arenaria TaxID=6604 RepID=A0ABY7FUN1_MYAAR|nr:TLR22-like protein [Mya arenaria]
MATCKMNFDYHQNVNIPQLPPEKDYHVFVCYVSENVNEVHRIVENLEKGGIKCCYHERDFTPGHGIFDNMRDKINASVHMLVVLSEDFSKSSFAQHELKEAIHRQIREDFSIIPLKIEPCDVPDILENKTYIDCENDDITEIHRTIIKAVIESDEDIEYIEKIANQSLFMKNLHIHDFFPRITLFVQFNGNFGALTGIGKRKMLSLFFRQNLFYTFTQRQH